MSSGKFKSVVMVNVALAMEGGLAALVGAFWLLCRSAMDRIRDLKEKLLINDVGLTLGTSKLTRGNFRNLHFDHRMIAAAALYQTGRVRHLSLGGDNGSRGYDEPVDTHAALLALGVSGDVMTFDDAGFQASDSAVGARKTFGQHRMTIITDRFHAYRAVFPARHPGLDPVAYPAEDVELRRSAKSKLRGCLDDAKACLDIWVPRVRPRFPGASIPVRVANR